MAVDDALTARFILDALRNRNHQLILALIVLTLQ